jgi:hypothetical protein
METSTQILRRVASSTLRGLPRLRVAGEAAVAGEISREVSIVFAMRSCPQSGMSAHSKREGDFGYNHPIIYT